MDIWTIDPWSGEPSSCVPEEHDALAWLIGKELHGLRPADSRLPSCCTRCLMGCREARPFCRWAIAQRSPEQWDLQCQISEVVAIR